MLEFLFGSKKKKASVAAPAAADTAAAPTAATAVLEREPELPELEKVRKNYSKPLLPRDEVVIKGDIDEILRQRTDTVQAKDLAVAHVKSEIEETKRLADKAMLGLLAIEADLKASIIAKRDNDIKALNEKIATLENKCKAICEDLDGKTRALNIELNIRPIDLQFPRIDMSFLKQNRKVDGKSFEVPKFGLFSIDDGRSAIAVQGSYYRDSTATSFPVCFASMLNLDNLKQYAATQCRSKHWSVYNVKVEATFKGAIPAPIRELLVDSKKTFESVYLVNEPEWKVEEVAVPFAPPRDPLVIGCRDGFYWLIASFDTTPAEEYIRREFTQGELKDLRG